jgi:hypothetical protein
MIGLRKFQRRGQRGAHAGHDREEVQEVVQIGVEAVSALEALHRPDEPVDEVRALDLELVQSLRVRAPLHLSQSALDQPRQVLRLAAELRAHAERLEQRVDLVVALAHQAGDDALATPRLGLGRLAGLYLIGHVAVPPRPHSRRPSANGTGSAACG